MEGLKVATLIIVAGDVTYESMLDLSSLDEPETKSYHALVKIVENHLQLAPFVIAKRQNLRQEKENPLRNNI